MEAFSLYFLSLLVVLISFSLRFLCQRYESKRFKLPTGTSGFPLVGETLHLFLKGPEKFMSQRMEKYSEEVFTTSLIGQNVAVICGAAGNKFLLCTANDVFVPWVPATMAKLLSWGDSPGKSIRNILSKLRKFHHSILRPDSLKEYIQIMDYMTRQHLKTDWDPFQVVKVHPLSQKLALSVACKLVLGLEDPNQARKITDSLYLLIDGFFSLPINLPGTTYNRALKEVQKLKQEYLKIIAERKKMILENREKVGSDILSRTLLDENAHLLSDSEIALYIVSLILPSSEATSTSITVVLKYLAELPHIYDMVYNEHMEIAKSKVPHELLNWEDIKKMKYSWNVICESMRLMPPGLGTFREAQIDIEFAGVTIPKGWKVLWSSFTTNKNPKYFPEPETFDPTRFEGDGPTPYAFIPFSAGPRMCPGKEYSKYLILIYMYNVVTKFKLQKLIPNEKILHRGTPCPAHGLPMRLQPH